MNEIELLSFGGIKVMHLIFGFAGVTLVVLFTPAMRPRDALGALVAGMVFSGMAPALVEWGLTLYLGKPTQLSVIVGYFFAVVFGIGGMFIVPGLIFIWREFGLNPMAWINAFVDFWRGKAPPSPPSNQ